MSCELRPQLRAVAQPASSTGASVAAKLDGVIEQLFHEALLGLKERDQTDDARVHGTRKHLKRLRALARLLDALEKERLSAADRFALQILGRSLGRVRAPAAELAAWRQFSPRRGPAASAFVVRLLEERRAPAALIQRRLLRSERVLAGLRQRVAARVSKPSTPEEYAHDTFLRSLRRAYRKGRRAMRRAQAAPTWARLHALRRAAKHHRYQLQFLELFFGKRLARERSKLARLTDKLGEHHDLGGIERYLQNDTAFKACPGAKGLLKDLRRRLDAIEARSLELANKSFRERPKAFEARLRRDFESLHGQ